MSKLIDLTGQQFTKLTVIKRSSSIKGCRVRWLCKCSCGKEVVVFGYNLQSENTQSCGCFHKEIVTKHNLSNNKIYKVWTGIISRCYHSNYKGYHNYGGRGIIVCDRWIDSPENFIEDMGEGWKPGLTIERINNNKEYCKSNCCWATRKEQNQNKRNNHLITNDGKTQCLAMWANEMGISETTIRRRLKNGWTPNKTLTTPTRQYRRIKNAK